MDHQQVDESPAHQPLQLLGWVFCLLLFLCQVHDADVIFFLRGARLRLEVAAGAVARDSRSVVRIIPLLGVRGGGGAGRRPARVPGQAAAQLTGIAIRAQSSLIRV